MAQVFLDDGSLASDFIVERRALEGTTLHIRSAPTPACTASLAIGREIVDMAAEDFAWQGARERRRVDSPYFD